MSEHADVVRDALMGIDPHDPTMWEQTALAALDALVAERDEALRDAAERTKDKVALALMVEAAEAEADRLKDVVDEIESRSVQGAISEQPLGDLAAINRIARAALGGTP